MPGPQKFGIASFPIFIHRRWAKTIKVIHL